jgi:hypothetical protein
VELFHPTWQPKTAALALTSQALTPRSFNGHEPIEYAFGDRSASVEFIQTDDGVKVQHLTFVAETEHPVEQQKRRLASHFKSLQKPC